MMNLLTFRITNAQEVKCEELCGLFQACCCQCRLPPVKRRIAAPDISLYANVEAPTMKKIH